MAEPHGREKSPTSQGARGLCPRAFTAKASYLKAGVRPRQGSDPRTHSHSMVAGGLELKSRATRLTPGISLMMRLEIVSSRSYGRRAQSAVIASSEVTARMTIG